MAGALDAVASEIERHGSEHIRPHPFYLFEPWDVEKRPEWLLKQSLADGVDLYSEEMVTHYGRDPHPFQSGFIFSEAFMRALIAGTQVGKSYPVLMMMIMTLTGEIPYSLRHPKGYDTGIKRLINERNIIRFGRRLPDSGLILDHNPKADPPNPRKPWDCGTVQGAGVFPVDRIAPYGSEIWLGTFKRALDEYWWPRLTESAHSLLPKELIDHSKGVNGVDIRTATIHLVRESKISCITYESGYERFEAASGIWMTCFDEEPPDSRVVQAAQQRSNSIVFSMTPYRGITYTKELLLPKERSAHKAAFHATQYDCPYKTKADIEKLRSSMEPHDVGARVYGLHTETAGAPYFDRMKIGEWMRRFKMDYKIVSFVPDDEWLGVVEGAYQTGIKSLMDVKCHPELEDHETAHTWRVYEMPSPGAAYLMAVDPSLGGEDKEDTPDPTAALIFRWPESQDERPVLAASYQSRAESGVVCRVLAHAMRCYNNTCLAAETGVGSANAMFEVEMKDWPHWYRHVAVQDPTQRAVGRKGFPTKSTNRNTMFDLIRDWINNFGPDVYPEIPDDRLLAELHACVHGKNGRADHLKGKTLDLTICFGICLYVWRYAFGQVQCNAEAEDAPPKGRFAKLIALQRKAGMIPEPKDTKPNRKYLGAGMPAWRTR